MKILNEKEPPTVFNKEQAEDECNRQGWGLDKEGEYVIVKDKLDKEKGRGLDIIEAVNNAMRGNDGFYVPPWERREQCQRMQRH